MKKCLHIAILLLLLVSVCRKNKEQSNYPTPDTLPFRQLEKTIPANDSLLEKVLFLQNKLRLNPDNDSIKHNLTSVTFDTVSGSFMVAGTGLHNKKLPQSAREAGAIMAAQQDAQRWALYLKTWYQGFTIHFGEQISGTITYSTILLQKRRNDTLFLLLQIPLGSISLQP